MHRPHNQILARAWKNQLSTTILYCSLLFVLVQVLRVQLPSKTVRSTLILQYDFDTYIVLEYWSIRYWSIGVLAKSRIERRALGWRGTLTEWSIHTRIPIYQILSRYPHVCHLSQEFFAVKLINRFIPMNQTACGANVHSTRERRRQIWAKWTRCMLLPPSRNKCREVCIISALSEERFQRRKFEQSRGIVLVPFCQIQAALQPIPMSCVSHVYQGAFPVLAAAVLTLIPTTQSTTRQSTSKRLRMMRCLFCSKISTITMCKTTLWKLSRITWTVLKVLLNCCCKHMQLGNCVQSESSPEGAVGSACLRSCESGACYPCHWRRGQGCSNDPRDACGGWNMHLAKRGNRL